MDELDLSHMASFNMYLIYFYNISTKKILIQVSISDLQIDH